MYYKMNCHKSLLIYSIATKAIITLTAKRRISFLCYFTNVRQCCDVLSNPMTWPHELN